MPGLTLIGGIGCFATSEGRLCLATVLDLRTRGLIGYTIALHLRAALALDAITAAHRTGPVAGNAIRRLLSRSGQVVREAVERTETAVPCCASSYRIDDEEHRRQVASMRCGRWPGAVACFGWSGFGFRGGWAG